MVRVRTMRLKPTVNVWKEINSFSKKGVILSNYEWQLIMNIKELFQALQDNKPVIKSYFNRILSH